MSKLQAAVYFFLAYFVCSFLLCGDMLSTLANSPILSTAGSRDCHFHEFSRNNV